MKVPHNRARDALVAGLLGFAICCAPRGSGNSGTGGAALSEAPSMEELAGATYEGITDSPIHLQGGRWEGKPPTPGAASRPYVQLVDGVRETGDIDGDGKDEAVVVLVYNGGGSGNFVHVAVVGRRNGGTRNLATALVGDRVSIRSIHVSEGLLEIDLVQQGPGDPMCCPSERAFRSWAFDQGSLVEITAPPASTDLADLGGREWVLTTFAGEDVPAEPRITLVIEQGRVSGTSACNEYFAEVEEPPDGGLSLGILGGTKRLCAPEVNHLETRYLAALREARRVGFHGGRLALFYDTPDGKTETLIFTAREERRAG